MAISASIAALATMAVLAPVAAHAADPDDPITACFNRRTGAMRLIPNDDVNQCKPNESYIRWNRQGAKGAVGPAGPQGATGATGATGAAGAIGPAGPMGLPGPAGETGQTGAQGSSGPEGPQGSPGPQGPQGPEGPQGSPGPQGSQGPAGAGLSVYLGQGETVQVFSDTFRRMTGVCDRNAGDVAIGLSWSALAPAKVQGSYATPGDSRFWTVEIVPGTIPEPGSSTATYQPLCLSGVVPPAG